jgi:hypothetical protein
MKIKMKMKMKNIVHLSYNKLQNYLILNPNSILILIIILLSSINTTITKRTKMMIWQCWICYSIEIWKMKEIGNFNNNNWYKKDKNYKTKKKKQMKYFLLFNKNQCHKSIHKYKIIQKMLKILTIIMMLFYDKFKLFGKIELFCVFGFTCFIS